MASAFAYYFGCNFKNQVRVRLRRLRRPKYLVSALAGLAYLYATSFRFLFDARLRHAPRVPPPDPAMLPLLEIGAGLALVVLVVLPWILPIGTRGLAFKEAEVQFLFPAPLGRRALLHFRILKGQLGILFGVAISGFFFARGRLIPHPRFLIVDLWIVYTFLALYNIGSTLALTGLAERGLSGLKRQITALALVGAVVCAVVAWVRWFVPPPPMEITGPQDIFRWIAAVGESGPAHYVLLLGRLLVRPALTADEAAFLRALVPALGILGLAYLWIIRSDASFEEASVERLETSGKAPETEADARRQATRTTSGRPRRPWFRLDPVGPAFVAFLWKNLIAAGRYSPGLALLVGALIGAVALAPWLAGPRIGNLIATITGSIAAGVAVFFVVLGPVVQRDDLRSDLLRINLLKSYPTPGWSLVLGEVLAPATVLAITQWLLLALAALFTPDLGRLHLSGRERAAFGVAAALVLPGFGFLGLLVQNAAALILPGWVQLGKERQHGVEAMGQRLIMMAATLVVLLVAVVPAAMAFTACVFVGHRWIGLGVVPIAAAIAALGLAAEAALGVVWLGRLFDRFDPSAEQEVLGEDS